MKIQKRKASHGFTLIELLVVISIIGFMSGMFLVAYRGALQETNAQKTRITIQKISEVLSARMDEYASYPISLQNLNAPIGAISGNATAAIPVGNPNFESPTILLERARLLSLRNIISMEMPDHPDDIRFSSKWPTFPTLAQHANSLRRSLATGLVVNGTAVIVENKATSRVLGLLRRLAAAAQPWDALNANAELLFLVVEDSQVNGSNAIEIFGKSEIGDVDGDGLNEFIDAFGRPIQWIRWPAGFEGIAKYHPDMLGPDIIRGIGANIRVTIASDSLDRLGVDPGMSRHFETGPQSTWELFKPGPGTIPLVVSAGQDNSFGIRFELSSGNQVGSVTSYSARDAVWTGGQPNYPASPYIFADPWFPRGVASPERLGSRLNPTDRTHNDNITNYDGNGASL